MDNSSSSSDRDPLERLAAEFLERRRSGENPSPSEYAEQYPQLAEQILEFFPALEVMEGLKPGSREATASVPRTALLSPRLERLGEYRILRELGRGGMGVVYEANQESLGRRVALKILPLHGRIDPVQMERFQLESRSAARLHHTGIVPVYGVGEHGGVHYYAMQYIQGHGLDVILEDLRGLRAGAAALPQSPVDNADENGTGGSMAVARSLLTGRFSGLQANRAVGSFTATSPDNKTGEKNSASLSPALAASISSVLSQSTDTGYFRAVARLGIQVANALAHAHGQGVLHRDIKPSNLLLDMDGHVWITDFGLAKVEGSEGPTQTGDIIGTLRYMSPERFEGWSDRRSDLYGLGMTLYELLTLHPAFEAATRAKLIDQVLHDPPLAPRKHDPRVPRDLETIVMKAIAKEPGERYPTAEALSADLENFVSDRPIVARRSSPPERAWRWCRRNKAAAGLLAASAVAGFALVGVAVGFFYNRQLTESAEREQRLRYIHQIVLAEREWSGNNMPRAEQLLDECQPERRGWEWNYLKRLCHAEILTLRGHEGTVWSATFSPDGRRIASAGADQTVKIWEAATGRLLRTLEGHKAAVARVAYSPDGTRLAAVSGEFGKPGRIVVWNVETNEESYGRSIPAGFSAKLVFSHDGKKIAVSSGDVAAPRTLQVLSASTGAVERTIDVAPKQALDLAFSPDDTQIAAAFGSNELFEIAPKPGEVGVWSTATGRFLFALRGHAGPLLTVDWSPDGQWIASAGWDQVVKIWDVKTQHVLHTLRGHGDNIYDVGFSHDGRRLVSASNDASARIWDPATGEEVLTLRGHRSALNGVAFSPDDRQLVTSSDDGTVKIWDAASEQASLPLRGHQGQATSVAFDPSGRYLLSASSDKSVKVWDLRTGRIVRDFTGSTKAVWCAVYSPDGRVIASAGGNWDSLDEPGEVILWDATSGRLIHSWKAHSGVAWCVSFSHDGKQLATAGGDLSNGPGDLIIWDCASFQQIRSISATTRSGTYAVEFSPDDTRLASTGIDGKITLWDAASGQRLRALENGNPAASGVAFDSDGKRLVTASGGNTLSIWDVASGRSLRTFVGHTYWVTKGIFSHDGRRLVSASVDHSVKVWEVETGQELLTLRGHVGPVRSVAISSDGQRIASASLDGIVRIWDATPKAEPAAGHGPASVQYKPK